MANSLKVIAQLIKGRSDTSVYYARQGGYDTHNNQVLEDGPLSGRHFDLLQTLNGALGAFVDEMKAQGNWDRVVILTFSEFGRKVIQNGSYGTDHGAAETLFLMGGQVAGNQYYGLYPDLAADARVAVTTCNTTSILEPCMVSPRKMDGRAPIGNVRNISFAAKGLQPLDIIR